MSLYLSNAFSLSMIADVVASDHSVAVKISEISVEEVKALLQQQQPFVSAIGHASTADILSCLLGTTIQPNRISVKIKEGDKLIVFQVLVRLEEGRILSEEEVKQLPAKFFIVELLPSYVFEALYHW